MALSNYRVMGVRCAGTCLYFSFLPSIPEEDSSNLAANTIDSKETDNHNGMCLVDTPMLKRTLIGQH